MNIPTNAYYAPVVAFQPSYASRLAWAEPRASFDWEDLVSRVCQIANAALSSIDALVQSSSALILVRSGKNTIRNESVFIYHTYSRGNEDEDVIVAGITVEKGISHVTIRGDIAGEESGVIYSEIKVRTVAGNNEQVSAEVRTAADELAKCSQIVAAAVASLSMEK